jgi:uncharacterized protein with HEPN domain
VQEFTANLTYEAYLDSILTQSAVERQLGILGEAARRLSNEFRQAHLEIDWRRIIGLCNILIHRYDEIRQQTIWKIVTSELRPLLAQLEPLLPKILGLKPRSFRTAFLGSEYSALEPLMVRRQLKKRNRQDSIKHPCHVV